MNLLITTLAQSVQFYSYLLIIRLLLTWFPTVDWSSQPFAALSQISDPYLNLFRSIIPPLGRMDFSPILAYLALNIVGYLLNNLARFTLVTGF